MLRSVHIRVDRWRECSIEESNGYFCLFVLRKSGRRK
jgi:hypothetical protein